MGGRIRAGALCRGGVMEAVFPAEAASRRMGTEPTRLRVEIVTFGCRLNTDESEAMRAQAEAAGHADLVIVNTCAVTAEATRQARQTIRRLAREKPQSAHRRHRLRGADRARALRGHARGRRGRRQRREDESRDLERRSRLGGGEKIRVDDIFVGQGDRAAPDRRHARTHARLRAGPERLRSPLHLLHHPLRPGQFALRPMGAVVEQVRVLVAHGDPRGGADRRRHHRLRQAICPARRSSARWSKASFVTCRSLRACASPRSIPSRPTTIFSTRSRPSRG